MWLQTVRHDWMSDTHSHTHTHTHTHTLVHDQELKAHLTRSNINKPKQKGIRNINTLKEICTNVPLLLKKKTKIKIKLKKQTTFMAP